MVRALINNCDLHDELSLPQPLTHHWSSRETEAPHLRYCRYSCCMAEQLPTWELAPLFPRFSLLHFSFSKFSTGCRTKIPSGVLLKFNIPLFIYSILFSNLPPCTGESEFTQCCWSFASVMVSLSVKVLTWFVGYIAVFLCGGYCCINQLVCHRNL